MFWRSFCPVTFTAVGPWTSTRHEKRKKQLRIWLELLEKRKKRQLTNSWKCQIIHELFSFKCQHQFDTCTATQKFQLCTQDDNSVAAAPQKYHQCGLTPSTLANSVKYFFFLFVSIIGKKMRTGKKKREKKNYFRFMVIDVSSSLKILSAAKAYNWRLMSFKRSISFCVTWSDWRWPSLPNKDRGSDEWLDESSIIGGQEVNSWAVSSFSVLNNWPSWRFFSNVLMMTRGWNLSVSKCLYLGAKNAFVNGPRWVRIRTHWPLAMSHTRALPSSEPV